MKTITSIATQLRAQTDDLGWDLYYKLNKTHESYAFNISKLYNSQTLYLMPVESNLENAHEQIKEEKERLINNEYVRV